MLELSQSRAGRYRAGKLAPLPPGTNQEEWPSYTRAMQDWSRFVSAAGEFALPSFNRKGRAGSGRASAGDAEMRARRCCGESAAGWKAATLEGADFARTPAPFPRPELRGLSDKVACAELVRERQLRF